MVPFKSFLKQPSKTPSPQGGCATPPQCPCQALPPVSGCSGRGCSRQTASASPSPHPAVTSRARNSRRCCGRMAWLAAMDPAAAVSRARPAEGRIGSKSMKIVSRQHPKGSGPGLGHGEDRPACGRWDARAVLAGVLPLLRSGGSGRAGADTPASVSSFQGESCAALRCLPCLGTLTALAAQGTSASCRLPVWHRPSPSAPPPLRGWINPWHLGEGDNTGRGEVTAEETSSLPAK